MLVLILGFALISCDEDPKKDIFNVGGGCKSYQITYSDYGETYISTVSVIDVSSYQYDKISDIFDLIVPPSVMRDGIIEDLMDDGTISSPEEATDKMISDFIKEEVDVMAPVFNTMDDFYAVNTEGIETEDDLYASVEDMNMDVSSIPEDKLLYVLAYLHCGSPVAIIEDNLYFTSAMNMDGVSAEDDDMFTFTLKNQSKEYKFYMGL